MNKDNPETGQEILGDPINTEIKGTTMSKTEGVDTTIDVMSIIDRVTKGTPTKIKVKETTTIDITTIRAKDINNSTKAKGKGKTLTIRIKGKTTRCKTNHIKTITGMETLITVVRMEEEEITIKIITLIIEDV